MNIPWWGELSAKVQEAPAELLKVNPIFNVQWVARGYKTVPMVWWLCTSFHGYFTSALECDGFASTTKMSQGTLGTGNKLRFVIVRELALKDALRKALCVTSECRTKPSSWASKQCHMSGKPDRYGKPGRWQPAWGKCADHCWLSEQEYSSKKRRGTVPLRNWHKIRPSVEEATLQEISQISQSLLLFPGASGRETQCCTQLSWWEEGGGQGHDAGSCWWWHTWKVCEEEPTGSVLTPECVPNQKKALGQVRGKGEWRRYEVEFGDPQNGDDLGSNQEAIRALGLVPIAAFSNNFSFSGRGNILPKGSAHSQFLPGKPLPLKCECVCDNFQRRTEVQGSLGHMKTWDLGLSAAALRAWFMETWKQRDLFPCKPLFFLILLLSLVHLLGSVSLFKLFFPLHLLSLSNVF